MNSEKPVELGEKIQYLREKINRAYLETRRSEDIELRLNFEEYVDDCINSILNIRKAPHSKSPQVAKLYSVEAQQIESQKKALQFQIQGMEEREKQIQKQTLSLKILSLEKQMETKHRTVQEDRRKLRKELEDAKGRIRFLEQEIEQLAGLNRAQQLQIESSKKERNRAEVQYLQLRDRYQEELSLLERYGDKNPKYLDRNTEGLKCHKYYTNVGGSDGSSKGPKLISLKLPVCIQVNRLVYGVLLGVEISKQKIQYYDKFQLYEKEFAQISAQNQAIVIQYKKRKTNSRIVLDKYPLRSPEIVVMLHGKGDSIIVHE